MSLDCVYPRLFFNGLLLSFSILLLSCDSDSHIAEHDLDDRVESIQPNTHSHSKNKDIIGFGFDLRSSPQEDARQYLPFLAYLEKETGYKFKLHFTPESQDIADIVGENHVQFAALGAVSFLRANAKHGVIPVVRGVNPYGKAKYQSVFVVAPKSKIKSLHDIKGKRLAFGSRSSTQGHLIPRIVLSKNGINLKMLSAFSYTGSHQNCANAVASKNSDVCAMQDTMAKNMAKKNLLKIIHTSAYYPSSGIVANKNVPTEVLNKVKQALLNFEPQGKDKEYLYHWYRTEMPLGFTPAHISDYSELKKWAVEFGFLDLKEMAGK